VAQTDADQQANRGTPGGAAGSGVDRNGESSEEGRSARKRRAITEAATALFLRNGYQGTSMDQVAAQAAVSKQTVYKNFTDKEQLFTAIVLGVADKSEQIIRQLTATFGTADRDTADDLERLLTELARSYLHAVLQPDVLALRRMVIAEADRFPDLARSYYQKAPARAIEVIADGLRSYIDRGLLRAEDAAVAASHFAYLILAIPQDKALFCPDEQPTAEELDRIAQQAVHVFLAAYGNPAHARRS
jgi:TetR/AcrR family transcriptional regulator, mexJK operon transcriptional repressor